MSKIKQALDALTEMTSGCVASVAMPLGATQQRENPSIYPTTSQVKEADTEDESPTNFGLWRNSALIGKEQKAKRQSAKKKVSEGIGPNKNDPWEKGWFAGHHPNREDSYNPYERGSAEYKRWQDGYDEAQAQPDHYNESEDDIPDLEEVGEIIKSSMDAERRLSNGDRIFAFHEMDDEPHEIFNVEELTGYAPDRLLAVSGNLNEYDEGIRSNNPQGIPEGEDLAWDDPDLVMMRKMQAAKKKKMAVVKPKDEIGFRVADIGPGGREHNVKTDAAWDRKHGVKNGGKRQKDVTEAQTVGDITFDNGVITQGGKKIGTAMQGLQNGYHPSIELKLTNGYTNWYEFDTDDLMGTIVKDIRNNLGVGTTKKKPSTDPAKKKTGGRPGIRPNIKRESQGVSEGVGREHDNGDQTVKVIKKAGKPIGEIGTNPNLYPGRTDKGQYYAVLYDTGYDDAGFKTAEEALAELKKAIKRSEAPQAKRKFATYPKFALYSSYHDWRQNLMSLGDDNIDHLDNDTIDGYSVLFAVDRNRQVVGMYYRTAGIGTFVPPGKGFQDMIYYASADPHWPYKDDDGKEDLDEGSAGWMLRQDPELAKKVRVNTQGYKDLKKMAGKPVPKKDAAKGVTEVSMPITANNKLEIKFKDRPIGYITRDDNGELLGVVYNRTITGEELPPMKFYGHEDVKALKREMISIYLDRIDRLGVEEARDGDVNFGHGVTADPYYAYDKANPEKFKRFKTRTGAKAFAEKHGWVIASAGFFYDNVKGKQGVTPNEFTGTLDSKGRFTKGTVKKMFGKLSPDAEGVAEGESKECNVSAWRDSITDSPDVEEFSLGNRAEAKRLALELKDEGFKIVKIHPVGSSYKNGALVKNTSFAEGLEEDSDDIHSARVGDEIIFKNPNYRGVIVKLGTDGEFSFKNESDGKRYRGNRVMIDRNLSQERRYKEKSDVESKRFDDALASDMERIHKSSALQKFGIGMAEATGDGQFDSMMKKVTRAPTAKERNAERIRQKRERQEDSRRRSADVFGTSPADKLGIRKSGVAEGERNEMDTPEIRHALERMKQRHGKDEWNIDKSRELAKRLAKRVSDPEKKISRMIDEQSPQDFQVGQQADYQAINKNHPPFRVEITNIDDEYIEFRSVNGQPIPGTRETEWSADPGWRVLTPVQGVNESSVSADDVSGTLNSYGYYTKNARDYVHDETGDKFQREGSQWKHQSGAKGRGPEELDLFLSSKQGIEEGKTGPGLWANIHAKRKRIKAGSGERMRKPGSAGAPSNADLKASRTSESTDRDFDGEYNDEAGMAQSNLHTIARATQNLIDSIDDKENLPEWVQEKIAKAEAMMTTARDYLQGQEDQGIDPKIAESFNLEEELQKLDDAKYQGRTVQLNKPMAGDVAKSKVYVKDPKTGNVKKVNFGQKGVKIKKNNPARRKSFRARHGCDNPGPKTKAKYWSCRAW
jgi:hypothetical protein